MSKTAILLGATGLTGQALLQQLLRDSRYEQVVTLVRRPLGIQHPKLKEYLLDFDHPDPALLHGDDLYCTLGTTLKKAGSEEAQYQIDCEYPTVFGRIARENGVSRYLLVSSVGANAQAKNFYLRTKGTLEKNIRALGFDLFVAARPSFLLGNREELRPGERIGIFLAGIFRPFIPAKYQGIHVEQVASALIGAAHSGQKGNVVLEGKALKEMCA
jgi:uncharacterized protein YbjT (DUF2867 family)